MITKIEMQTMNALINLNREYTKQNSFIEVHGYTKESAPIGSEEGMIIKYHTYQIRVRDLKRIEKLDSGDYELLIDSVFASKFIVTDEEFENKIKPIL